MFVRSVPIVPLIKKFCDYKPQNFFRFIACIVPINAIVLFRNRLFCSTEQAYKDMTDITKVPSKCVARHP